MEELGRGGRLRGDAAGELVVAAYAAESAHGPRLARGLSLGDLAHAVTLVEGGDLSGDDARSLLLGLLEEGRPSVVAREVAALDQRDRVREVAQRQAARKPWAVRALGGVRRDNELPGGVAPQP